MSLRSSTSRTELCLAKGRNLCSVVTAGRPLQTPFCSAKSHGQGCAQEAEWACPTFTWAPACTWLCKEGPRAEEAMGHLWGCHGYPGTVRDQDTRRLTCWDFPSALCSGGQRVL